MWAIAYALEQKNPFAYFFLFLILYPPIMIIVLAIIDWIKNKLQ